MLRYPSFDTKDRLILMLFHTCLTQAWQIGMRVCVFPFYSALLPNSNNCPQSLHCLTRNPISQYNSVWMRSCRQQTDWWHVTDPDCMVYRWVLAALYCLHSVLHLTASRDGRGSNGEVNERMNSSKCQIKAVFLLKFSCMQTFLFFIVQVSRSRSVSHVSSFSTREVHRV